MTPRQRVQISHGLRKVLRLRIKHALVLGYLLDDSLIELLLLLLLGQCVSVLLVDDLVVFGFGL